MNKKLKKIFLNLLCNLFYFFISPLSRIRAKVVRIRNTARKFYLFPSSEECQKRCCRAPSLCWELPGLSFYQLISDCCSLQHQYSTYRNSSFAYRPELWIRIRFHNADPNHGARLSNKFTIQRLSQLKSSYGAISFLQF